MLYIEILQLTLNLSRLKPQVLGLLSFHLQILLYQKLNHEGNRVKLSLI